MLSVNNKVDVSFGKFPAIYPITQQFPFVLPLVFIELQLEILLSSFFECFGLFFTSSRLESLPATLYEYFGVFLVSVVRADQESVFL